MHMHLKRILVLPLLLIASLAHADPLRLQALHEFRSEGFEAGTYLLIDNNLYERVREATDSPGVTYCSPRKTRLRATS